jgi:hypothetical protein
MCGAHCESTEMFVQMEKAITEHLYQCALHAEEKYQKQVKAMAKI